MSTIPENLYYTEEHEWISVEGDVATIGITDFAQSSLGDIVFVELPDSETEFEDGDSFGVVESIKSVSDLYTPLSGTVLEKNEEVEDSPEKLNENAFGSIAGGYRFWSQSCCVLAVDFFFRSHRCGIGHRWSAPPTFRWIV